MNSSLLDSEHNSGFGNTEILLVCCIIFQLVISLMPFHYGDGYFRDEFYFIAMSNHLGWGYVDVPPLAPFLLSIVRSLFGSSLFSIHLLPAISGTIVIFFTYKMVKILGGGVFAAALALIPVSVLCSILGSRYIYDVFDMLFWTLMLFCLVKLIGTENRNWWIYFGVFAGLGLLTKVTVVFLGAGIVIALMLTKERKSFKFIQLWLAGIIALAIFSPYIIWNACNGFPTLEFFSNYSHGKLIHRSVLTCLVEQVTLLLPAFPIWILGLYYFIFNKKGKKFRFLGIAYVVILALCIYKQTRPSLVVPYYTVLLAGGGVFLELQLKDRFFIWLKLLYLIFLTGGFLYILPEYRPTIPLNLYIKYYGVPGVDLEGKKKGVLTQIFADRFGWRELAEKVAKVYNSLPPEQRARTAIFTDNYGEAGAIAFYGKKYGLPFPISGHNQYYLWGPRNYTGESMIMITSRTRADLEKAFKSVKLMDRTNNKYCMPYEDHLPIWLCQGLKFKSLKSRWPTVRHYD